MATARATLAAEHRDLVGKKVARLRHAGRLPAVVYGHGIDSNSVSIDAHDFEQLRRHSGPNALVDLSIDGAKAQPVRPDTDPEVQTTWPPPERRLPPNIAT